MYSLKYLMHYKAVFQYKYPMITEEHWKYVIPVTFIRLGMDKDRVMDIFYNGGLPTQNEMMLMLGYIGKEKTWDNIKRIFPACVMKYKKLYELKKNMAW